MLTIHRNTNYIKFRARIESTASKAGDILEAWKDSAGWHIWAPAEGKRYQGSPYVIRVLAGEVLEQSRKNLSVEWRLSH